MTTGSELVLWLGTKGPNDECLISLHDPSGTSTLSTDPSNSYVNCGVKNAMIVTKYPGPLPI